MPRSKSFRDYLIERLKDPKQASMYFDAILTECEDCDEEEGRRLIVAALKHIADAQGGVKELAKKTKLKPTNITTTFSALSIPKLSTIITIKDALLPSISFKK